MSVGFIVLLILSVHTIFSLKKAPEKEELGVGRGKESFEMRKGQEHIWKLDIPQDIALWVPMGNHSKHGKCGPAPTRKSQWGARLAGRTHVHG